MENERIKDTLRVMVYDRINHYLNHVDVLDFISDDDIDAAIEDRMADYITNNLGDALEEVLDEIFDEME